MRTGLMFLLISFATSVTAQKKLDVYTATNNVTYHEGDTLKVGRGSMPNGDFKYFQMTGFNAMLTHNHADAANMPRRISGYNLIIKKIRRSTSNGADKITFTVAGAGPGSFNVDVENAIAMCEIVPCSQQTENVSKAASEDKYDKLKKLKALLDSGAITQAEYDEQKKKLLNEE